MVSCPRCGYSNQPTSKFCASCGAPMPVAQPQQGGSPQAASPQGPAMQGPSPQAGHGWGAPAAPPAEPPAPQGWGPPGGHPAPGAYNPAAAPSPYGGPPPDAGYGPPPQPAPPHGQHPQAGQYAPANPGWGPQQPPYQQASPQGGFSPSAEQARVGTPDGLNPFGETMAPGHAVDPYAPPPAAPSHQAAQGPAPHPYDPAAYAATARPPTNEEFAAGHYIAPGAGAPEPPGAGPQQPVGQAAAALAQALEQQVAHGHAPPPAAEPPGANASSQPQTYADPEVVPNGAPRVLVGFLVSFELNGLGSFWPLYQGANTVGRKDAADGLQIEIDHPTTSSRHAVLLASARPGRLKVQDTGSTNGTYVRDQRLEPGTKHELRDGEEIRFGGFPVTVKLV